MPKLLTPEMKNKFFSILNLPDQFQLDCKNAFDYFHDNPTEMKFRRKHDPQKTTDPSPSFIFKEGKIYALARNVLGEGAYGRVKLLLEIIQNPDQLFSPGEVTVVKIERGEETDQQKFEHQVSSQKEHLCICWVMTM